MSNQPDRKVHIINNIHSLSKKLDYPINNYNDLARKIGEDFDVSMGIKNIKLNDVKDYLYESFFPIVDNNDLVNKATDYLIKPEKKIQKLILSIILRIIGLELYTDIKLIILDLFFYSI